MNEKITMIIAADGTVEIETEGFAGVACEQATQHIVVTLQGKIIEEQRKDDYYQDATDVYTVEYAKNTLIKN